MCPGFACRICDTLCVLIDRLILCKLSSHFVCGLGASSVPTASVEARCREADAKEIRACSHVSAVKAPAVSLRRLHVTDQVSSRFVTFLCCSAVLL